MIEEYPVELPSAQNASVDDAGVDGRGVADAFVRVVRVVAKPDRASVPLVPDPRAVSTWVVPGAAFRVLDPEALSLHLLGPARIGRPLALQLRARDARDADTFRVTVEGRALEGVRFERDDAGLRARLDLPPLQAPSNGRGLEVRVEHEGVRDGRRGVVELVVQITPGPPPRVLSSGVDGDAPIARALGVQGFELVDAAEHEGPVDLWLADLSVEAPSALLADVDRGAGVLLTARAGASMHASWSGFVPVLAVEAPTETPENVPETKDDATATKQPDKKPDDGELQPPTKKADPKKLRRTGDVADDETRAARDQKREIETKAVALVLLIDVSGSMSGPLNAPAIVRAKRAALESAAALGEGDSFALITFGTRARVELELGPASRRDELELAINRLEANASATRAFLAITGAWAQLKRSDAPVRHVLLLTDGDFTDKSQNYRSVVRAMQREGIGISAIGSLSGDPSSLSAGKFRFLERLLATVGSKVAIARSSNEIPRLVLGEVREVVAAARPMKSGGAGRGEPTKSGDTKPNETKQPEKAPDVAKEPEAPTKPTEDVAKPVRLQLELIDREPVLTGLVDEGWPALAGALPVEAKSRARVHWSFAGTGRTALATSLHGLGRIVFWAGDAGAKWASEFAADKRYPALVAQLAAWAQAPEESADVAQSRARTARRRVLVGDGLTSAILERLAKHVGGKVVPSLDTVEERRARELARPVRGQPTRRILLLIAAFFAIVAVEFALRRR